jgi:ATP-binding cassette subfamily B protein
MGLPALDIRAFLDRSAGEATAAGRLPYPGGDIRFESVTFAYPGQAEPVLDRVSLVIREGERVALVGPNGAGKTTLIKLMLGLYRPNAGRITIGDINLCDIAPAALRDRVSCVFQDFARLDLTLADNISACAPDVDPASIAAACAATGLTDTLAALPQGAATQLGKTFSGGVELSGGQWQRIALARAFARDARLVVLDEPTAALDPLAELEVYAHFAELMAGRTTVLISHRLGAARLSERILVLDRGRIVEDGAHSELIAAQGLYASLFRTQAGWYQEVVG